MQDLQDFTTPVDTKIIFFFGMEFVGLGENIRHFLIEMVDLWSIFQTLNFKQQLILVKV